MSSAVSGCRSCHSVANGGAVLHLRLARRVRQQLEARRALRAQMPFGNRRPRIAFDRHELAVAVKDQLAAADRAVRTHRSRDRRAGDPRRERARAIGHRRVTGGVTAEELAQQGPGHGVNCTGSGVPRFRAGSGRPELVEGRGSGVRRMCLTRSANPGTPEPNKITPGASLPSGSSALLIARISSIAAVAVELAQQRLLHRLRPTPCSASGQPPSRATARPNSRMASRPATTSSYVRGMTLGCTLPSEMWPQIAKSRPRRW